MKRIVGMRGSVALVFSVGALVALAAPASSMASTPNAVTKTFSFIAGKNSHTSTLLNIDGLLINARCNANGFPVVFAFSSASAGDIFAHIFDGAGRLHILHNTSFSKGSRGVLVSTTTNDQDSTGMITFEGLNGSTAKVVTVNYAFDNSTTLNRRNVCTVFGSYVAS
jgi:hypothetical protein